VEFAQVIAFARIISEDARARQGDQGWTDEQMVMSLVLVNLAGGDCVKDLVVLEGDEGFCQVLREVEHWGRTGSEKRALRRRWRKKRMRTLPNDLVIGCCVFPRVLNEYSLLSIRKRDYEGTVACHFAFPPFEDATHLITRFTSSK
jgi:hypothetical protein